jgi:hypothetical protein
MVGLSKGGWMWWRWQLVVVFVWSLCASASGCGCLVELPSPFPSDSWWCCGQSRSLSLLELGVLHEGGVFWLTPAVGGRRVSSAAMRVGCVELPLTFPLRLGWQSQW